MTKIIDNVINRIVRVDHGVGMVSKGNMMLRQS
jgi:hypothetical protein